MRLADLNPRWLRCEDVRHGQAVLFDCPCGCGCELIVPFANPLDGGAAAPPQWMSGPRWQRTGETFETLTLNPSVNYVGHWHGWISAGEVTNA